MDDLAARVRAARGFADLSQSDLAERLGLEKQSVVRTEAGKRDPKLAEQIAIAHVCGVPVAFMVGGFEGLTASSNEMAEEAHLDVRHLDEGLQTLQGKIDSLIVATAPERLRREVAKALEPLVSRLGEEHAPLPPEGDLGRDVQDDLPSGQSPPDSDSAPGTGAQRDSSG